jgi:hypothetical protein
LQPPTRVFVIVENCQIERETIIVKTLWRKMQKASRKYLLYFAQEFVDFRRPVSNKTYHKLIIISFII